MRYRLEFAMDTYMSLTLNGNNPENSIKKAEAFIKKLDRLLSAHDKSSEIFKLNNSGRKSLSPDSLSVLKSALKYYRLTDGAFNPAMLPVTTLWGFPDKKYRVPDSSEVLKALKLAKPEEIKINGSTVKLGVIDMKLDLGGIAKGYASQKTIELLKKEKVDSALINLGGNIQTLGKKPDGSLWTVAVENPNKNSSYLGQLKISDKAVITSGGYERYFKKNGKTYHHIIDPENGYPAVSGLKSVTIISDNGIQADALSTALFVMGREKAVEFWKTSKSGFDFILYTDNGKLLISEGIENSFYSDLDYEVINE